MDGQPFQPEAAFGRAAVRLHIAQPPLSQQIRSLEDELGVQLFHRTKRQVRLTEAGQAFLAGAYRTLDEAERTIKGAWRAYRGELGQLVIGFVGTAGYHLLPSLIQTFRDSYPDVELILQEKVTTAQIQALKRDQIDLGFLRPPIHDPSIALKTVLRESLVVALPENHALTGHESISVKTLAKEPFIIFPRHLGAGLHDQIISLCQQRGFSPKVIQEAIQMQTIISLVAVGMGVSLLPASVRHFQRTGVVIKPLRNTKPLIEIALAWKEDNRSPVLKAFLEMIQMSH